jgi:hypothetical protein
MHLSGFGDTATSNDFGYDYRVRQCGDVEITLHGRNAAVLKGAAAQSFLARIDSFDDEDDAQDLMQSLVAQAKRAAR